MKAFITPPVIPVPPPTNVTIVMTEEEAKLLRIIVGTLGTDDIRDLLKTTTAGKNADVSKVSDMVVSLYIALWKLWKSDEISISV